MRNFCRGAIKWLKPLAIKAELHIGNALLCFVRADLKTTQSDETICLFGEY